MSLFIRPLITAKTRHKSPRTVKPADEAVAEVTSLLASETRAGLRDLLARMGHASARAAMIHQIKAHSADKAMTDATDAHVRGQQEKDDGGAAGVLVPAGQLHTNCTVWAELSRDDQGPGSDNSPDLGFRAWSG
jgi:hypothetical protein